MTYTIFKVTAYSCVLGHIFSPRGYATSYVKHFKPKLAKTGKLTSVDKDRAVRYDNDIIYQVSEVRPIASVTFIIKGDSNRNFK